MIRTLASLMPVLLLTFFFAASASASPDLVVGSFNALHLGWGSAAQKANKCNAINKLMERVDILLLQETMQDSFPCTWLAAGIEARCSGLKGRSSYREAYCAVYKTSKLQFIISSDGDVAKFSRPPRAILMKYKSKDRCIWFANIHSAFGNSRKERRAEAAAAGELFVELASEPSCGSAGGTSTLPVLFAGDWNNPVTNSGQTEYEEGFAWVDPAVATTGKPLACPMSVATSLSASGRASSAYDHIIITGETLDFVEVDGDSPSGDAAGNQLKCYLTTNKRAYSVWRKEVSDHIAIYAGIRFR